MDKIDREIALLPALENKISDKKKEKEHWGERKEDILWGKMHDPNNCMAVSKSIETWNKKLTKFNNENVGVGGVNESDPAYAPGPKEGGSVWEVPAAGGGVVLVDKPYKSLRGIKMFMEHVAKKKVASKKRRKEALADLLGKEGAASAGGEGGAAT